MRLQFILSEIGIGLRRNLSMTISVILVTFVSLTFVGAAGLLQMQVSKLKDDWYGKVEVTVLLCPNGSSKVQCAAGEATPGAAPEPIKPKPFEPKFVKVTPRAGSGTADTATTTTAQPSSGEEPVRITTMPGTKAESLPTVSNARPLLNEPITLQANGSDALSQLMPILALSMLNQPQQAPLPPVVCQGRGKKGW